MSIQLLILLAFEPYPGKATFARPYSSTTGVSSHAAIIFTVIAITFLGYISIGVWRALKKDKEKYGNSDETPEKINKKTSKNTLNQ
jgi:hypothetical protein